MGLGMEIIDTYVTNPSTTITATTPFPGDVLAVRSFDNPSRAWLADAWTSAVTAGVARVRSPRLHDNVQGIRFRTVAAAGPRSLMTTDQAQRLYSQDTLITEMSGEASGTDGFSLLNMYEDLPGVAARLASLDQIAGRIIDLVNVEVALASGAAVGTRSASVALNGTFDLLKANTDYALLGVESDTQGLSIGIRGPDTGNLRIGAPMASERLVTNDWFVQLNKRLGVPTIPIIQSANKAGTLIDNAQVVTGLAANVTLVMAQLSA